jgi:L-malate glycosyltransferase
LSPSSATSQTDSARRRKIKICFIGNPASPHVNRWAKHFANRGFDVVVLTYIEPALEPGDNLPVRFLRPRGTAGYVPEPAQAKRVLAGMPGLRRLTTWARFKLGGFYKALDEIDPDVVHGHYVSDYGFLAAAAGRRPLVVSVWGSDILVDPVQSRIVRMMVGWTLRQAALITYDAEVLAEAALRFGAKRSRLLRVVAGVDEKYLEDLTGRFVPPAQREHIILSHRSLARSLFNVDKIIRAMPKVIAEVPGARLLIGHDGELRPSLERLASELGVGAATEFIGYAHDRVELAARLGRAAVYVSIPSSDGTSVTLLEALAAGAYPVVSDLPANREWVSEAYGGIVSGSNIDQLAEAIIKGLREASLRAAAAGHYREVVRQRGLWETNMAQLESVYRDLAITRGMTRD